jgi:ribonuclease P protein subunit POP4
LIGLHAKIIRSTHKGYMGIEGPIVRETRNTIALSTGKTSLSTIPKSSVVLELTIPGNLKVRIDGSEIIGRPENRIKMKKRKNPRRLQHQ